MACAALLSTRSRFARAVTVLRYATLWRVWKQRELSGVSGAWREGRRLWLDRAVHQARRADHWPPSPWCEGGTNRLGTLLITFVGVAVVTAVVLLLVVLFPRAAALPLVGPPLRLLPLGLLLLVPMLIAGLREAISRRVSAASPYQCWGWEEEDWPPSGGWPDAIE